MESIMNPVLKFVAGFLAGMITSSTLLLIWASAKYSLQEVRLNARQLPITAEGFDPEA
jgi:hypothetical protein